MDKSEKLNKLLELLKTDTITPKEIEQFLNMVVGVIKDSKEKFETISAQTLTEVQSALEYMESEHESMSDSVKEMLNEQSGEFKARLKEVAALVDNLQMKEPKHGVDGRDGLDGKDADEESVISQVLSRIEPDTGENIVEKINNLSVTPEYQIDWAHIKNAPEFTGGGRLGSTARNLWQLNDVTLSNPANNDVLKYDSATKQWVNGTGGGSVGPGTINEIAYFDTTTSIASLSTATYPSLTELSYVKGVTSSIQTQLDTKFVLPSLTAGSVLFSDGTTIAQDNANFFWDNPNNRLGILTNSPAVPLDVRGNTLTNNTAVFGNFGIQSYSDTNGFLSQNYYYPNTGEGIRRATGAVVLFQFADGNILFRSAGTGAAGSSIAPLATNMVVYQNTGHVSIGMGLNTPSYRLDVQRDETGSSTARIRNENTGTGAGAGLVMQNSTGIASLFKLSSGYTTNGALTANSLGFYNATSGNIAIVNNHGSGKIVFAAGSTTANMLLDTTGNLGLGLAATTVTPTLKLHVIGSDFAGSSLGQRRSEATIYGPYQFFEKSRGTPTSPAAVAANDLLGGPLFYGYHTSAWNQMGGIQGYMETTTTGGMAFFTTSFATIADAKAKLTSAGNLGLGSSAVALGHFQVSDTGTATTRGIAVSQHNTGVQGALMNFYKSRGTETSPTTIVSGDYGGIFTYWNHDGTAYRANTNFGFRSSGTIGTNSIPGQFFISTHAASDVDPYTSGTVRFAVGTDGYTLIGGGTSRTEIFTGYDSLATNALQLGTGQATSTDTKFATLSLVTNQTGTANAVGSVYFSNSSLGAAEKRIAFYSAVTGGATNTGNLIFGVANAGTLAEGMRLTPTGLGVGTVSASARLHAISTTEQLRIGYNTTNYFNATVASNGATTFNAVGSGAAFAFSDTTTFDGTSVGFRSTGSGADNSVAGFFGVGVTNPSARIHAIDASNQQLRLGYNGSNYLSVLVGSTGSATINLVGTSPEFTFSDPTTFSLGIKPRVVTTADDSTAVIDVTITDQYQLTAMANSTTISTTGTPIAGQKLTIRLKDDSTARAITWDAIFRAVGVTLPTTTVISKTVYIGCIYNATDSKFDAVAVAQEA